MRYRMSLWYEIIAEAFRRILYSMISFQAIMAVIFTGMFATKILQVFGVSIYIQNAVFVPCTFYVAWALCIGIVDHNIERDVL